MSEILFRLRASTWTGWSCFFVTPRSHFVVIFVDTRCGNTLGRVGFTLYGLVVGPTRRVCREVVETRAKNPKTWGRGVEGSWTDPCFTLGGSKRVGFTSRLCCVVFLLEKCVAPRCR